MCFLNRSWICWNCFCSLIRFKGTNDSISSGKEGTGSPWSDDIRDMKNITIGYSRQGFG